MRKRDNKIVKAYIIKHKTLSRCPMHLYCYHFNNKLIKIVNRILVPTKRVTGYKLVRKFKTMYLLESKPIYIQEYHLVLIFESMVGNKFNTKTT